MWVGNLVCWALDSCFSNHSVTWQGLGQEELLALWQDTGRQISTGQLGMMKKSCGLSPDFETLGPP